MDYSSAQDLLTIYGNRNPISNFIFDRQIADQEQNRQLKMANQAQTTRTTELSNLFDEQNNPTKLLDNQEAFKGRQVKNASDVLDLELKQKTQAGRIDSAAKDQVLKASEADLRMMENAFQQMAYSKDPAQSQQGMQGLQLHRDFVKIREQGVEARKTSAQQQEHAKALEAQKSGNARSLEELRASFGKYSRGKSAGDVNSALSKVRSASQAAEVLENAYYEAAGNGDMQQAEQYKQRALAARQRAAEDAQNRSVGAPGAMYDPAGGGIVSKPMPSAVAPIAGNNTQTSTKPQLSAQDQQALQWAKSNSKDPRAKQILDKLGIQ